MWQACKRNRRHSDAVAAANLAREWRRRRLEVDLGAFRAERHDDRGATENIGSACDRRKRLQSTTKAGLTGNAAAAAAILDQMEKGPLSAQLATAEQEMAAASSCGGAVRAERETQLAMEEERAVAAVAAAAAGAEEEEELGFGGAQ